MRVAKVLPKSSFVPSNSIHTKRVREKTEEFAIFLSASKNEINQLKKTISPQSVEARKSGALENFPKPSLDEAKRPPLQRVVEKRKEEKLSFEDRKLVREPRRTREARPKECIDSTNLSQASNLVRLDGNIPERSKNLESKVNAKVTQDPVTPFSNRLEERVTQDLKVEVNCRFGERPLGVGQDRKGEHKNLETSMAENTKTSTESFAPSESKAINVHKDESSASSSAGITSTVFQVVEAGGEKATKEEPKTRHLTPTVPKGDEEVLLKFTFTLSSNELSEHFAIESDQIFTTKERSAFTPRKEIEDVAGKVVQTQVPVKETPASHYKDIPLTHERTSLKDQKDVLAFGERDYEFEAFAFVRKSVEKETVERVPLEIENTERIAKNAFSFHAVEPQRRKSEEGSINHHEMGSPTIPLEQHPKNAGEFEAFQEVVRDTRIAEVPVLYERRERIESFRETLGESLSELVQHARAHEAYILQGTPREGEMVSVHSIPKIVERMYVQKQERALMTLNPPELGRVEVVIEKSGEEVRVVLKVFTEEAKNALEREVPQLVERLSERGFDVHVQVERHQERDLLQEGKDRRERRQREKYPNRTEGEDFSETMKEVVG